MIVALIPAYKPGHSMVPFIRELATRVGSVVVVNDGSGDAFDEIFHQLTGSAVLLRHEVNQGKGAALKTGLRYILDNMSADVVVTADCDGQHEISDIMAVAQETVRTGQVALGTRTFGKSTPLRSRFGNNLTVLVHGMATGVHISDTQTGLRAFPVQIARTLLPVTGNRYEYEMNMLLTLARKRVPMTSVPIKTVYIDDNKGSHFRPFQDSLRIYRTIIRFSASSLLATLLDYVAFIVMIRVGLSLTSSVLLARAGAALINFTINKDIVFENHRNMLRQLMLYAVLSCFSGLASAALTGWFQAHGVPVALAKPAADTLLFIVNYLAQKNLIFR